MLYLKSVGCFLDQDRGIIYPSFTNDTPDLNAGVSLTEDIIPGEWIESLDKEDLKFVKNFLS
jgi:hypothetical protein